VSGRGSNLRATGVCPAHVQGPRPRGWAGGALCCPGGVWSVGACCVCVCKALTAHSSAQKASRSLDGTFNSIGLWADRRYNPALYVAVVSRVPGSANRQQGDGVPTRHASLGLELQNRRAPMVATKGGEAVSTSIARLVQVAVDGDWRARHASEKQASIFTARTGRIWPRKGQG
jgi:hypothetical protein